MDLHLLNLAVQRPRSQSLLRSQHGAANGESGVCELGGRGHVVIRGLPAIAQDTQRAIARMLGMRASNMT